MGKKYMDTKDGSLESSILSVWEKAAELQEKKVAETNKNDKSDDGEGLDAVQPDAVKKKFKDRKDKDIDNDGDTDDSDEYLHKKRKAISKNTKESWMEAVRKVEGWKPGDKKEKDEETEDDEKDKKVTETGKKPAKVEINPKVEVESKKK